MTIFIIGLLVGFVIGWLCAGRWWMREIDELPSHFQDSQQHAKSANLKREPFSMMDDNDSKRRYGEK